jgi:recombination protein RecA
MPHTAATIRLQIESALAQKMPSALTPIPKIIRPIAPTGIEALDEVLEGGLPVGAISELVGPECSGRTSVALSFLARLTEASRVCAWIDVSNTFDPVSAASAGIDLARLLWIRCGVSQKNIRQMNVAFALPNKYLVPTPAKKGLHGGGFGPHPRGEARGLSNAVSDLLRSKASHLYPEPQRMVQAKQNSLESNHQLASMDAPRPSQFSKPWSRMEQALRTADLLLQSGGFSAIALDMGSISPEFVSRVPLATWFRYRAAAERTQSSIVLLTQHACATSSAELLLRFQPGDALRDEATVFTGMNYRVEVARRRFADTPSNIVPLRKPPQRETTGSWHSRVAWAGRR